MTTLDGACTRTKRRYERARRLTELAISARALDQTISLSIDADHIDDTTTRAVFESIALLAHDLAAVIDVSRCEARR